MRSFPISDGGGVVLFKFVNDVNRMLVKPFFLTGTTEYTKSRIQISFLKCFLISTKFSTKMCELTLFLNSVQKMSKQLLNLNVWK